MNPQLLGNCWAETSGCSSSPKAAPSACGKCPGVGSPWQGLQVVGKPRIGWWMVVKASQVPGRRVGQPRDQGQRDPRGWAAMGPGWLN